MKAPQVNDMVIIKWRDVTMITENKWALRGDVDKLDEEQENPLYTLGIIVKATEKDWFVCQTHEAAIDDEAFVAEVMRLPKGLVESIKVVGHLKCR